MPASAPRSTAQRTRSHWRGPAREQPGRHSKTAAAASAKKNLPVNLKASTTVATAAAAAAAVKAAAKAAAAKVAAKAAKAKTKTKTKDCPICLQPILADGSKRSLRSTGLPAMGPGGCPHEYCHACLSQYCSVALQDNKGLETGGALPCPVPACRRKGVLAPAEVKALVTEAAWEQHKERRAAHQVCYVLGGADGWMDGWMDGWIGWMDRPSLHACMQFLMLMRSNPSQIRSR